MPYDKLDLDQKLIDLFHEYMDLPEDKEDRVENSLYHNVENCQWRIDSATGKVSIGNDYSFSGQFKPLDVLYGQDSAMRLVEKKFKTYLVMLQLHALVQAAKAIQKLQSMKIPVEYVEFPNNWIKARIGIGGKILGVEVTTGTQPRALSEAKYGRFVEFELKDVISN